MGLEDDLFNFQRWSLFRGHKLVFAGVDVDRQFKEPIPSMYGISTYIYHKNQANVGKYTSPMDPMGNGLNPQYFESREVVYDNAPKLSVLGKRSDGSKHRWS